MLRITHLTGSLEGKSSALTKSVVRLGRAADCDVRFDAARDPKVSNHHAEFILEQGCWYVVDVGSTNGILIAGQKVKKRKLATGDIVQLGRGGPSIAVEVETVGGPLRELRTEAVQLTQMAQVAAPAPRFDNTVEMSAISGDLKLTTDTQTANLAELAAKKVAEERKKVGGGSSGQTMMIMANTLKQVQQTTKKKTRKSWVKVVIGVGATGVLVAAVLGVVIVQQKRQINQLVQQKARLDKEIESVERQMQEETDPDRLASLEERLNALAGTAEKTIDALGKSDKKKAAEVANTGDELDRQIRAILRKFDAPTYAVPPLFKERLKFHIEELAESSNLKFIYRRKQRYWPLILREFGALGLPEEMAYIAWAETQFDPTAKSPAGAAGMWQLTASTARNFNLKVEGKVDERYDAEKETKAAAHYLANLLAEYGSDSFMLAMASYNRGESGVRRVLHQIAQEQGGFRKGKRDFWHLYRLKKLPEETREYVPKVLAAAIVSQDAKRYGLEDAQAE